MKNKNQIPDEIIEQLRGGQCKLCGCSNPDIFEMFYPEHPGRWGGYAVILYPLCSGCLGQKSKSLGNILQEELLQAQLSGDPSPFPGYQSQKPLDVNEPSPFDFSARRDLKN